MMIREIKNLLITFFLSAFTFAPVLAGAVQNKLSSSEIYLKVMSVSEQIKNLNLSQDSVRLLRMSEGRSENLKSLLQLESASIQREEGKLVSFLDALNGVSEQSLYNVHIELSFLPDLKEAFSKKPDSSTLQSLAKEISTLGKYLKLQAETEDINIQIPGEATRAIIKAYKTVLNSVKSKGLQESAAVLRYITGVSEVSVFNPYLYEYFRSNTSRFLGKEGAPFFDFQQLQALSDFSKTVHNILCTTNPEINRLLPIVLHLEDRITNLMSSDREIFGSYARRVGSFEPSMMSSLTYGLSLPPPGFGLYLDVGFKAEVLYLEMIHLRREQAVAFDSFASLLDRVIKEKSDTLQGLFYRYNSIPIFFQIPFLAEPSLWGEPLDMKAYKSLISQNLQIRRSLLAAASKIRSADFFMNEAFRPILGLEPKDSALSNISISYEELDRLRENLGGIPDLEKLVDRDLVYSFIRDSIYQGTAKEELLPLLESSSSAKISFYQKMLNLELGRIMHLSDQSSRQKRVEILNRNLNVLKALIEREKKL